MLVVVTDTGLGNLTSVQRAVETAAARVDASVEVVRSREPALLARAERVVVPGQGAWRDGVAALAGELGRAVRATLERGTPYLGICLGLQLLFESSDEAPGAGLGWFPGRVSRLTPAPGVKVPHLGWNALELVHGGHPCLEAAGGPGTHFYFVHSFHAEPLEDALVKAVVQHGPHRVTAAVARDHVLATQFHPEKSQRAGLALLEAFVRGPAPGGSGLGASADGGR